MSKTLCLVMAIAGTQHVMAEILLTSTSSYSLQTDTSAVHACIKDGCEGETKKQ